MSAPPPTLPPAIPKHDEEELPDNDNDTTGSLSPSATGGEGQAEPDDKRKKKLELNRIASRESRKRKKRRLEELQRSVLFLTHENHQLREQNELLRQMLVGRLPGAVVAQAAQQGEAGGGPQLAVPTGVPRQAVVGGGGAGEFPAKVART